MLAFGAGSAQAQQRTFDLPEGRAVETLPSFALQSGIQIIAPSKHLRNSRTPRLYGAYDARQALKHLIRGTDLVISSDRNDIVTLRDKNLTRNTNSSPLLRPIAFAQAQSDYGLSDTSPVTLPQEQPQDSNAGNPSDIVVIGSQIKGAKTTGALPVSVVGAEQVDAVAAVSGADLFRSIPQLGGVSFNEQALGGGSANTARGDVSTVSLRGLGQGNTLLLINGRRTVLHPTSQVAGGTVDGGVPIMGFNANTVPVGAIERVEVLRDGAAALYGSDAVAGVINNVLKSNFTGVSMDAQYGGAEGTNLREFTVNGLAGFNFGGGRGNISLYGGYARKSKLYLRDQDYTASADKRSLLPAGSSFANVAAFNGTSTTTPWGNFQATGTGIITSNGVPVTNASRQFHVQPSTNVGCRAATPVSGVCYDDGNGVAEMATVDANLRFNAPAAFPNLTTQPSVERINLFSFINYELTDNLDFFGELGFYRGKTESYVASGSPLASIPITIAANAYWNPFGPIGSPNRLPGLNISAAGVPVTIRNLNLVDVGPRKVDVTNNQYRFLAGLRGDFGNWNWESAGLYTWATVNDTMDSVSNTLFQQAVNRTTADAYNPFNGGDINAPAWGDNTLNPQSTIDSFRIKTSRRNKTTLAMWDLKISNANLLDLWGGNSIGIATGIEFRKETFKDDRDPRQGGIIGVDTVYTDSVTGITYLSDILGASPSPDVYGKRNVWSAYAELAIPLISPEMEIPFIHSFDVQLAGRYENYSDVGDVAKPKIAASWDLMEGFRLRGSWSQGFRAPNLEVINTTTQDRSFAFTDFILCEADLRAGRISNFSACNRSSAVLMRTSGNADLKPEESTSWSFGAVLQQPLPAGLGDFTFTVDRWRIKQKGVIGLLDYGNVLALDYLSRAQGGAGNPNVVRRAPTTDDANLVAGTGIAPVGELLYMTGGYQNLLPVQVDGIDFNLDYRLRDTSVGNFAVSINAARLIGYQIDAPAAVQQLASAKAAGLINASIPTSGGGDVVGRDGQPRWRFSANVTWNYGPVTIGAFTQYISDVYENAVSDPNFNKFIVKGQTTANLYATYKFEQGLMGGTSITVGARNIFDKEPPLASTGYFSSLHQPQARYWYTSIKKSF